MLPRRQALALTAVVLLILVPILAGDDAKVKTIEKDVIVAAPGAPAGAPPFVFFGAASFDHMVDIKVVAGAPYSAQATTETVQVLADGNRIVRRNSTQIARDSQGRTRQEYTFTPPGDMGADGSAEVTMISINDPTTGITYTLHPDTRTADKIMLPEMSHVEILEGDEGNHSIAAGAVAGGENHVFIRRHAGPGAEAGVSIATEPIPGPHIARYKFSVANAVSDSGASEGLGKQVMEGVEVEGKRTTLTIPAGQIGNEQPIVITNESWYSPELQVIVFSKRDDPMAGTTTYRLTNIARAEPDPALFEVPADYTVGRNEMKMRRFEQKVPGPKE